MDKQPVGQLPDLTQSNNNDEIMVITNDEYNQLKKEKIADFITDLTSTDENNAIVKGTDGKLFTKDFGNASNITEGTLPVSVLPDIPKDKLPPIETADLPDSGITAGTYTYPTDIVVNSKGQVTSITEGQAGANNANQDLSNLGPLGLDKINQSKALKTGSVSSDADVYADVLKSAHSTFDLSKFTVVGSPNITDDGIASGFSTANYITTSSSFNFASAQSFEILLAITTPSNTASVTSYTGFFNTLSSDNTEFIVVGYELENSRFVYGLGTTTGTFWNIYGSNTIQPDTKYYIKIKVDNTTVTIQISTNGTDWITDASGTISSPLNIDNVLRFGLDRSLSRPFEGTIDLKSIAIWADGVPVFNGNKTGTDTFGDIEIPYTLSKTGSKIVDAAYRDRVQDMYEQTGEALFYTIDEENQDFTLPAGDIYGMISNTRDFSLNKTQITNCILSAPNGVATYSGSTLTIKGGLKYLTGNGRNIDKTLKNIEHTFASDKSCTFFGLGDLDGVLLIVDGSANYCPKVYVYRSNKQPIGLDNGNQVWFNTDTNEVYWSTYSTTTWVKTIDLVVVAGFTSTGTTITSLTPYQPVELIKRTDPQIQAPYITETYVNGTSWYRVWSDGFIEQGARVTLGDTGYMNFTKSFATTNYVIVSAGISYNASANIGIIKYEKNRVQYDNSWGGEYNYHAFGY